MKLFKSNIVSAVVLGALAVWGPGALAQDSNTGAQRGTKGAELRERFHKLAEELHLTAAQREQIKPIVRSELEKARALRKDASVALREKREKIKEIHQDLVAKIKPILTPEQLKKWRELRQENRQKH